MLPGQERFWFMWDDLSHGALGAVVLADVRRLADCFQSIDYFERRKTPFIVALNCFAGSRPHEDDEVRRALDLDPQVPIVRCDARQRGSSRDTLVTLVDHTIAAAESGLRLPSPSGTRSEQVVVRSPSANGPAQLMNSAIARYWQAAAAQTKT